MSLRELVKLPFLKSEDAPEEFEFLVSGTGSSQFGFFVKGTIIKTPYTEDFFSKKDHSQSFSKGYSIGLWDDSINYLMYQAKLAHLDELKDPENPSILSFKKNAKGYLVVSGLREWAE